MKKIVQSIFLLLILCLYGCEKKEPISNKDDFNGLMGEQTALWKCVQTEEDRQKVAFFKELYEKNESQEGDLKIPKVIHFIWIGPDPFPKESIQYVASWVSHHPDWKIKFWSDRRRPLPHKKMELHFTSDFQFSRLKEQFEMSDNYAEKADLLRYEILYREGGLYVDHDVQCFKPFTSFHHRFNLYCGLEPPHNPVLSSSISVNNNLIGATAHHPILKQAIEFVESRWQEVGKCYPGSDKESVIYRVAHRSFSAFDDAVALLCSAKENDTMVFPAAYFNKIDQNPPLFAHHYYASTWFSDETQFEKNVRRRLIAISRKNNQILLFNGIILGANLILAICLMMQYRILRKRR